MARCEASVKFEQLVLANVQKHGWHCTSVNGSDKTPSFTYTVGLYKNFDHPELIVFGLSPQLSHAVLFTCARAAVAGRPIDLTQPTGELLQNHTCAFVRVDEEKYAEYVLSSLRFYQGSSFPLYQVVWPEVGVGVFPWHPDAGAKFKAQRPVLGFKSSAPSRRAEG